MAVTPDAATDLATIPDSVMPPTTDVFEQYQARMQAARSAIMSNTALASINHNEDIGYNLAWLLHMCSKGVRMTRPADGWLARARARCEELGYVENGAYFEHHRLDEKDHYLMYMDDTRSLVKRWNRTFPAAHQHLDEKVLLDQTNPVVGSIEEFKKMHEQNINSDKPYLLLAVIYEGKKLAHSILPSLFRNLFQRFDQSLKNDLSFIFHHNKQENDHADEDEEQLKYNLNKYPESLDFFCEVGKRTLSIYSAFLNDVHNLAVTTSSQHK